VHLRHDRYAVTLATRDGNQSSNGLCRALRSSRCDLLLVLVADGRRWFIPAAAVEASSSIVIGGPKYAANEVEPGRTIAGMRSA
jgi:hypothetical protein